MSQENVELVRERFEAFIEVTLMPRPRSRIPDIRCCVPGNLEEPVRRGRGIRVRCRVIAFFATYRDAFGPHVEIEGGRSTRVIGS